MLLLAGADAAARAERWWIWRQQVVDLDAMGGGNGGSGQWIWRQRWRQCQEGSMEGFA